MTGHVNCPHRVTCTLLLLKFWEKCITCCNIIKKNKRSFSLVVCIPETRTVKQQQSLQVDGPVYDVEERVRSGEDDPRVFVYGMSVY